MSEKTLNIKDVFPYHACENNLIITGYGYITVGFDLMLPEVFVTSNEQHKENILTISNVIKSLPVGTICHKQDFFYNSFFDKSLYESNDICKTKNLEAHNFKAVSNSYSRLYLSFPIKKISEKVKNPLFKPFDYISNKASKDFSDKYHEVSQVITSFEGVLISLGWKPIRMSNEQLASAIYDYWNVSYSNPSELKQGEPMRISPFSLDNGELKVGNEHVAVLSVIKQPEKILSSNKPTLNSAEAFKNGSDFINNIDLETSFSYPIGLGLPIDHIVNTTIEVYSNSELEAQLEKMSKDLNFASGLGMFGGAKAVERKELIKEYIKNIDNQNYQMCKTSINLVVNHKDKKTLDVYCELAKQAFASMGDTSTFLENKKTISEFLAYSPGNTKTGQRKFITTTEHSIAYWLRESNYYSDSTGHLYLDRFGNPLLINTWENKYIEARNKVVFGPTGTGKSVLMNDYVSQALGLGHHVIGIDVGGSYKRNIELNGGLNFDTSDPDKLKFNPFLVTKDASGEYLLGKPFDENNVDVGYEVNLLQSIITSVWSGGNEAVSFDKETLVIIKKQIKAYFKYVNSNKLKPNFDSFYHFVNGEYRTSVDPGSVNYFDYDSFKLIAEEFTFNGDNPKLLNSEENFDFLDDKFAVFDLKGVEKNQSIKSLVAVLIINLITEKTAKLKGVRKTIFIDEAIDFLKGSFGDYIGGMYRKIRKENGEVIIATQSVAFLETADPLVMSSITGNTSTVLLLDHSKIKTETYPLLQKYFSFSDSDLGQLSSIQVHRDKAAPYGEFLLKMGSLTRIFRLQLSEYSLSVYDTRKEVVEKIEAIRNKLNCSVATAINLFIENKKNN